MPCIWDPARKTTVTVLHGSRTREILDYYLQSTFYETDEREVSREPQRRPADKGWEAREVVKSESWRRQWGSFCVRGYTAVCVRSPWFWLGVGAFVSGVVSMIAISVGVVVGADQLVTEAGGLTARGSLLLGTSTLILGTGLTLAFRFSEQYQRGDLMIEYETRVPMRDWERVAESTQEQEWSRAGE